MLVYLPLWLFSGGEGIITILHRLLFGYHHPWYLAGIIGAAPIIWMIQRMPTALGCTLAATTLLTGVSIQYVGAYQLFDSTLGKAFNYNWSHQNFLPLTLPFMYAGVCIRKFNLFATISENQLLAIFITGLALFLIESTVNLQHNVGINGFDNLLSLALIFSAIALLALRSTKLHSVLSLSTASSGIYLTHPALLLLLAPLLLNSALSFLTASILAIASAFFNSNETTIFFYTLAMTPPPHHFANRLPMKRIIPGTGL